MFFRGTSQSIGRRTTGIHDARNRARMIGVIARNGQEAVANEFFELFKTPWEWCRDDRAYDVVIATDSRAPMPPAKLVISFGHHSTAGDDGAEIEWEGIKAPIYGPLTIFEGQHQPVLRVPGGKVAGVSLDFGGRKEFRIGYDLFDEIAHLLRHGQPVKNAHIPTLEMHIAMLRQWILNAGIPLVEIPPAPYGFDFITCLTHDIDFMGLRDHKLDHSMMGFVYRSLVPKYLKGLDRKTASARYLKNLRALLSLPLVHAGILPDFWYPLDRYVAAEKDLKSTFFFLPFKDRPGESPDGKPAKYRAARYDVGRYKEPIRALKSGGREIGVHGIDSWRDHRKGHEEIEAIRGVSGEGRIGVRMHWLYFSDETPRHLEEAGFSFDSTLGYNETVGYRSGTTQVFRLPGTSAVYELPLNAQDTAMLYPGRMGASEIQAIGLCGQLIEDMKRYGGVFTVNWHDRSLAPERNWDAAYLALLDMLRRERTWFATAGEAVAWYEKRRAVRFEEQGTAGDIPRVKVAAGDAGDGPPLALRVHAPAKLSGEAERIRTGFVDRPLNPDKDLAVGY